VGNDFRRQSLDKESRRQEEGDRSQNAEDLAGQGFAQEKGRAGKVEKEILNLSSKEETP